MVNQIIADYLKANKRLVIPQFGAFIHKESDGTIAFVPFLKKDDGVLVGLLHVAYGVDAVHAQVIIEQFIATVKEAIRIHGSYSMEGLGVLMLDSNNVCYLVSGGKLSTSSVVPSPVVSTPAPSLTPPPVLAVPVTPPAPVSRPVAASSSIGSQIPSQGTAPTSRPASVTPSSPRPAVPQSTVVPTPQSRSATFQPKPEPIQPPQPTPSRPPMQGGAVQPGMPPPMPNRGGISTPVPPSGAQPSGSRRPPIPSPMGQRPQQPGRIPGRPPMGRPVPKRTKADAFVVIAILAAIVALGAMIFGFMVGRDGPDLPSLLSPSQATETPATSTQEPATPTIPQ